MGLLVRQMLQRRHIEGGRAHQICSSLAEAGAMARAVPLLLMWVPLRKHTQDCQAQYPGAGECDLGCTNSLEVHKKPHCASMLQTVLHLI